MPPIMEPSAEDPGVKKSKKRKVAEAQAVQAQAAEANADADAAPAGVLLLGSLPFPSQRQSLCNGKCPKCEMAKASAL